MKGDALTAPGQLHDALYHQFGHQIQQAGGVVSHELQARIIHSRTLLLNQLLTLSVSRTLPQCGDDVFLSREASEETLTPFIWQQECRLQPSPPVAPFARSPETRPISHAVQPAYALPYANNAGSITNGLPASTAQASGFWPPAPRLDGLPSATRPSLIPPAAAPDSLITYARSSPTNGLLTSQQAPRSTLAPNAGNHSAVDRTENTKGDGAQKVEARAPQPQAIEPTVLPVERRQGLAHAERLPAQHFAEPSAASALLRPRRNVPSTPILTKRLRANSSIATSPANYRFRAVKAAQQTDAETRRPDTQTTSYFALSHRPYVGLRAKEAILRGNGRLSRLSSTLLQKSEVFHVDFTLEEVQKLRLALRTVLGRPERKADDPYRDLGKLLKKLKGTEDLLGRLARNVSPQIWGRQADDIHAFLSDLLNKRFVAKDPQTQQFLSVEKDPYDNRGEELRESRLSSVLMAREIGGKRSTRSLQTFQTQFRKYVEDRLELRSEFTNCAGDISTISWVSDQAYIAGTTVHMDAHNQQYNKAGNLVLGSVSRGSATLHAYPNHRIVRPRVEKGENSTEAMRNSQDPWLYTSVVSSDYDPNHDRAYTSGFDKTVKIWKVEKSGSTMRCIHTWEHQGLVNFVQASSFKDDRVSLVATAADVPADAVRIYRVPKEDDKIAESSFRPLSCSRILNADGTPLITDRWTYFPSTMKWGVEASVKHLLLVGYSPRSLTNDDHDIPIERRNSGELCLWDALSGSRITITAAKTQNVFEVLWHPSQPIFIAATSPAGETLKDNKVKTQVRIFKRVDNNGYFTGPAFSQIKALDCAADDINELTILPNSGAFSYVTAGCTDGKAYVWDTALSDKPVQVLSHGPALEGVTAGDNEDDTGVKFTAWGASPDYLYTGSSDGVVKVWNVRTSRKKAKGRVLLEAAAQISFGAFSPDRSRLVIGDASGRIFVLSVNEEDGKPATFNPFLLAQGIKKRAPTDVTPHRPPPPPPGLQGPTNRPSRDLGQAFVAARQLRYSGDPTVGMVQDVNYAETGMFEKGSHDNNDPSKEILAIHSGRLQENAKMYSNSNQTARTRRLRPVEPTDDDTIELDHARRALLKRHEGNCELDLKFENLSLEIRDVLARDGIGQRELTEGLEYSDLGEDDEAELRKGKAEVAWEKDEHEARFWV